MSFNYTARGVLFFIVFSLTISFLAKYAHGDPQVPCYFIFGDSLAENGNNNNLATLAKANYLPYGIDFPKGPTGMFCNGQNIVGIIAGLLGFNKTIPPFVTARGDETLQGVNHASAAAGIRDETGIQQVDRLSLNRQLQNHYITVLRIKQIFKNESAAMNHLKKCIYTVGMGSNDYINNYFMPDFYPTSRLYPSLDRYAAVLIEQYKEQLKRLYSYGARKVAVLGLGVIGCTPGVVARLGTNGSATGCVDRVNTAAQLFNTRLRQLVPNLNSQLPGANFTYIDSIGIALNSSLGSLNSNATCCEVSRTLYTCIPNRTPCANRSLYVFYDGFHPTEIINIGFGARYYAAVNPSDADPYDIRTLARMIQSEMNQV